MKLLCAICAAVLGVAAAVRAEEVFDESRLEATVLAEPLNRPMQFEMTGDGRLIYIELDGVVKIFHLADRKMVTAATLPVFQDQENGLIGIALDPKFDENHWVYLQYSPKTFSGQHISRFALDGDKLDLSSEKLLLKVTDQRRECCHHAGSMRFGPDGCLYIATGDNTNPGGDSQGYAPIDQRPDKFPQDAQKSSSNTNDLRGKILRIRPKGDGTYEIPEGNLFPVGMEKTRPEIYVMGCRNPWRISVDMKSGYLYWGEVGPDAGGDGPRGPRGYDEVNQARKAGNFGWPYFVGKNYAYARVDFATGKIGEKYDVAKPVNESPNNTGLRELPAAQAAWIYYPYGASKEFPELGDGGRTACAGPVYHYDEKLNSPTKFPKFFDNCLFIYEWSRGWIKPVRLNENSDIVKIEQFTKPMLIKRPTDIHFGPDGAMYLIDFGETWGVNKDARLIRIDYVRGNRAPVARATAMNNIGKQPLKVSLSGKGSMDKDAGDVLTYEWRVGKDGKVLATTAEAQVTFDKPGVHNVQLTVADGHGAKSSQTVAVVVGNSLPKLSFEGRMDGGFFDWGRNVVYRLKVDDAEDNAESGEAEMSSRASVEAYFKVMSPAEALAAGRHQEDSSEPTALKLMKKSDCFNCHAVDHAIVGPAYIEVARKYRKELGAGENCAKRIIAGSTGIWTKGAEMLPHSQHTLEEAKMMAMWVLSLTEEAGAQQRIAKGLYSDIDPGKAPKNGEGGTLVLEAAYTDGGAMNGDGVKLPGASAVARMTLRTRRVEAEHATSRKGTQVLGGGSASAGRFIGSINHGDYLRFEGMNLKGIEQVTFRASSGNVGGDIELRIGAPDGKLLGKVHVDNTGGWEKWVEPAISITETPGKSDVYVVFSNPGKGGLMNLDWIYFNKKP